VLLIASFVTSHFGEWRQSWHGMPTRTDRPGARTGLRRDEDDGILAAIDADTGDIVYSRPLDTPAGFAVTADHLYVNSMRGNRVMCINQKLEVVDIFATHMMNDLHSIVVSERGLLITSSGTDSILEVSANGEPIWEWFAAEHGYSLAPSGHVVTVSRKRDYRLLRSETSMQSTHCNSAIESRLHGNDVIVASFFHQGYVVAIDRNTGDSEILLRGMHNPHSIRRRPGGWLVSDSRSCSVVLLNENFSIDSIIEQAFNWIQDALPVGNDGVLIADANHSSLVFWDLQMDREIRRIGYPAEWKIYQVEMADLRWELLFRAAAEH